ncbi:PAAR domain-containing protein [Jannaschia sp. LMIT008]|uniref:PAAR domain-containing protein n=1 Tax=Jannaschia maritima TaxID=3032585 RepID=UPI002810B73F|nr:PAAR domain-containing protein [Jannaschia sp. LMIT008]
MASKPVCHLGHPHACPAVDPGPRPHIGGPAVSAGQSTVRVNGIPVLVDGGGSCLCTGVPTTAGTSKGSGKVRIDGKGVMRLGDATSHGGKMVMGFPGIRVC